MTNWRRLQKTRWRRFTENNYSDLEKKMITVHHLENSRSQRVLWLLEELGADYEIKHYKRDKKTSLAPAALKKVHPLGKSPVVDHNGQVIAETGAIMEYLVDQHGGALAPASDAPNYQRYKYWMHAAEGSYAAIMVTALLLTRMETAPMPFFAKPIARKLTQGVRDAYLDHTMKGLFDYAEATLGDSQWLAGDAFSAADIIMSFPLEGFAARGNIASYKNIPAFLDRIHARPAYQRAVEKGGLYGLIR
jgi:glutathione S-transferase